MVAEVGQQVVYQWDKQEGVWGQKAVKEHFRRVCILRWGAYAGFNRTYLLTESSEREYIYHNQLCTYEGYPSW